MNMYQLSALFPENIKHVLVPQLSVRFQHIIGEDKGSTVTVEKCRIYLHSKVRVSYAILIWVNVGLG